MRNGSRWQRGTGADRDSVQYSFPLRPQSVRLARHATRYACRAWALTGATDAAELAVSELFGNAVKAGAGSDATLRLSWTPRRLRVEVCDACPATPQSRVADVQEEGGRGLWLIGEMAVRWGSDAMPEGKCVWAEFALPVAA